MTCKQINNNNTEMFICMTSEDIKILNITMFYDAYSCKYY